MELLFTPDESGTIRATGYATVPYSSNADDETVVETTEDDLSAVFETAKSNGETLDGADASIDAAIDKPLSYIDYLILDPNDSVTFDKDHVRDYKTRDGTSA